MQLDEIDAALRRYLDSYEDRAEEEAKRQQKRIEMLERQEKRLLQDRYADLIREDLFSSEMRRIAREREHATTLLTACEVKLGSFVETC